MKQKLKIVAVCVFYFLSISNCLFGQELSDEETKLYDMIMEYRASKGLPPIPLSEKLTYVARTHAQDLFHNRPDTGECNLHSWSNKGNWISVCYKSDHTGSEYARMKAREITGYSGSSYEIVARLIPINDVSGNITAEIALAGFKKSPPHNAAIVNLDNWNDNYWKAIGISIYANYACVWFGEYKK
jgi:uncharacterized protein YkwD